MSAWLLKLQHGLTHESLGPAGAFKHVCAGHRVLVGKGCCIQVMV
jgi:hypothetical protein